MPTSIGIALSIVFIPLAIGLLWLWGLQKMIVKPRDGGVILRISADGNIRKFDGPAIVTPFHKAVYVDVGIRSAYSGLFEVISNDGMIFLTSYELTYKVVDAMLFYQTSGGQGFGHQPLAGRSSQHGREDGSVRDPLGHDRRGAAVRRFHRAHEGTPGERLRPGGRADRVHSPFGRLPIG